MAGPVYLADPSAYVAQARHPGARARFAALLTEGRLAVCQMTALEYFNNAPGPAAYEVLWTALHGQPWMDTTAAAMDRALAVHADARGAQPAPALPAARPDHRGHGRGTRRHGPALRRGLRPHRRGDRAASGVGSAPGFALAGQDHGRPGTGSGQDQRGGVMATRWALSAAVTSPGADTLARCEAPRMTASRDRVIPRAMTAPCHGGVAGSSDPAITRVGAGVAARSGRRSMPTMASQQPAYPSESTPSSVAAKLAGTDGWRAAKSGVNQRLTTWADSGGRPPARTAAARRTHRSVSGKRADVQHTASASIRPGACAASHIPTIAPSDTPQYDACSTPKSSSRRSTSAPRPARVYGPGGAGEPPCPRCS